MGYKTLEAASVLKKYGKEAPDCQASAPERGLPRRLALHKLIFEVNRFALKEIVPCIRRSRIL